MKRKDIFSAPFVKAMEDTTANMYRLGWDERNGGNVSYLLSEEEVAEYLDTNEVIRCIPTGFEAKSLIGKYFIVTGTGKYFKNVKEDPETNLGIIRIAADTGFCDQNYFSVCFKKAFSVSPKEYRKR